MSQEILSNGKNSQEDVIQDILENFSNDNELKDNNNKNIITELTNPTQFSPQEQRIVKGVHDFIDIRDSEFVKNFGNEFKSDTEKFANNIINGTSINELKEAGGYIKEALDEIKKYKEFCSKKPFSPFFQSKKRTEKKNQKTYTNTNGVLENIEKELKTKQDNLKSLFDDFFKMGLENKKKCYYLKLLISAGESVYEKEKELLEDLQNGIINEENLNLDNANQKENLYRWQRKLEDVTIAYNIGLGMALQISNINNSIERLTEVIDKICTNLIPLWRINVANMIGMEAVMDCGEAISDFKTATNSLLINSSKLNKEMVKQTAKLSSSNIVEAETVNEMNEILISGLTEAEKIINETIIERKKESQKLQLLVKQSIK